MSPEIKNVSSGDPSGRWKPWAKWFLVVAVILALALMIGTITVGHEYRYVFLGAMAVIFYRHRWTEQRLDLLIDRHPVHLTLFTDVRHRVWIEWNSQGCGGRATIGNSFRVPTWLDHEIAIGEHRYKLRIYAKKFPDGYMVSNAGRGFQMTVTDNKFCF